MAETQKEIEMTPELRRQATAFLQDKARLKAALEKPEKSLTNVEKAGLQLHCAGANKAHAALNKASKGKSNLDTFSTLEGCRTYLRAIYSQPNEAPKK